VRRSSLVLVVLLGLTVLAFTALHARGRFVTLQLTAPNPSGLAVTMHQSGAIDIDNAFFLSLGTNGRSCATCHAPEQSMSFSAAAASARFDDISHILPAFVTLNDCGAAATRPVAGCSANYSVTPNTTPAQRRRRPARRPQRAPAAQPVRPSAPVAPVTRTPAVPELTKPIQPVVDAVQGVVDKILHPSQPQPPKGDRGRDGLGGLLGYLLG